MYDEATKTCVGKLCGGYTKTSQGHSNRIFSVNLPHLLNPTTPSSNRIFSANLPHLLTLTTPSSKRIFSAKFSPTKPQP